MGRKISVAMAGWTAGGALAGTEQLAGLDGASVKSWTTAQIADYMKLIGLPWTLAKSSAPATHTGDTNETELGSFTVPAGALGPTGHLEIVSLWSFVNTTGGNKTPRLKFGGTNIYAANHTANQSLKVHSEVANIGAANSQEFFAPSNNVGFGSSSVAVATAAIDTTANVTVQFTGQLADASDSISLRWWIARATYGA